MMRRAIFRRGLSMALVIGAAILVSVVSAPLHAQSTGMIKGKVTDIKGDAVDGAKVIIEYTDGVNRKYETKSNKKGEFIQIGLQPGNYRVTAQKDKVGTQSFDVRVRLGVAAEVGFQLQPEGSAGAMTKEEVAKLEAFKKVFDAGVAASNAGNFDEAVAKFTEALTLRADCYACQYNIGGSYVQKKDYANAEAAFKKAAELKPDSAEPYNALANIYNSQKKFEEAAKMTEEATKRQGTLGGGGNADQMFNQGVVFWNAGRIADAKKQFEEAVKLNPGHAEAHYWVGMASLNEGKLEDAATHFEEYLKLAPDGQYAAQAKGVLSQIKK